MREIEGVVAQGEAPGWPSASARFWSCLLWVMVVGATVPIGGEGTSAGPHLLGLVLLALWQLSAGRGAGALLWPCLGVIALLVGHLLLSTGLSPCKDLLGKSVASQVLLMALMFCCAIVANAAPLTGLGRPLMSVTWFVTLTVLLHKLWLLVSGASALIRPSGLYSEPSHLALAVAPLLVAQMLSIHRQQRWTGWGCGLLLFLLSGSGTLFIVVTICLVVGMLAQRRQHGLTSLIWRMPMALIAVAALIWLSPFRESFAERIAGVVALSPESNLSSVVYVAGWQMAAANIESSDGLGLGLNRMGCEPRPVTEAGAILNLFELDDGNYNDGSFIISKLLSEFGWFGAGLWGLLGLALYRAVQRSRASVGEEHQTLRQLLIGAAAVMVLGGFVRGNGYFAPSFVLGVWALLMLQRRDLWR